MHRWVRFTTLLLAAILWCGALYAAYCIKCGEKIEKEVRFCPKCGHKVGAPLREVKEPEVKAREMPSYQSIEEANAYYELAEQERNSAGALLLPVIKHRRYRKALGLYLKILEKWPVSDKCEYAAYRAAQVYESIAVRDYPKAIKYYRMVVEINPATTLDARLQVAQLTEHKLKDYQSARVRYEETIDQARVQDEKEAAARCLKALTEKIKKAEERLES
jgi:tetratricopeptide (TPR) repeat protein